MTVSHETIYAHVYGPEGRAEELARHLPGRREEGRPRYARRFRNQVFPPERAIYQRPEYVETRETFGEWEGDLMNFERAQGSMNVATLVERTIRFAALFRIKDRSSTHFMNSLMNVMTPLPQPARKSITFDRGFEFRDWRMLKAASGQPPGSATRRHPGRKARWKT